MQPTMLVALLVTKVMKYSDKNPNNLNKNMIFFLLILDSRIDNKTHVKFYPVFIVFLIDLKPDHSSSKK